MNYYLKACKIHAQTYQQYQCSVVFYLSVHTVIVLSVYKHLTFADRHE